MGILSMCHSNLDHICNAPTAPCLVRKAGPTSVTLHTRHLRGSVDVRHVHTMAGKARHSCVGSDHKVRNSGIAVVTAEMSKLEDMRWNSAVWRRRNEACDLARRADHVGIPVGSLKGNLWTVVVSLSTYSRPELFRSRQHERVNARSASKKNS